MLLLEEFSSTDRYMLCRQKGIKETNASERKKVIINFQPLNIL